MANIVDKSALPEFFPTHLHEPAFWEALGRTVATYGFLEETLGKAYFAFSGTKTYTEAEVGEALEKWLPKLEQALSDPLGGLIDIYVKSVKEHPSATIENLKDLEADLREASRLRNALCHCSWRAPNAEGFSRPFYVEKRSKLRFTSEVDIAYLVKTQHHVANLAMEVVNTVTSMGWQFPGSNGPGKPIK